MKKGVHSGPWNGIGSLNSRTRISRLIGALHTGLTQKTVWYTEHAREEGEGSGGREGRQARGGVGGVAMAGGGARGGQPVGRSEGSGSRSKGIGNSEAEDGSRRAAARCMSRRN